MKYYHVSICKNRESIQRLGVDPIFSQGKNRASWWCDQTALDWAVLHVMRKYKVFRLEIDVWVLHRTMPKGAIPYRAKPGVYYTRCANKPDYLINVIP
jgi:hypothetical protein